MKLSEQKLREIIKEEIDKLNESDYSIDNLKIDDYKNEITIASAPGKKIDIKYSQIPKLIKILQKFK
jgi:hypothetical protein